MTASADRPRLADLMALTNGLNAVRVLATLLVVVFHAAIPYVVSPLSTTVWLVHDARPHFGNDVLLLWTNGFIMPLFFLLAGMSAARACESTPWRDFAWQRFRRLIGPFLLISVIFLPPMYIVWGWALVNTERITMSQWIRVRFPDDLQQHLYGPGHLWFLEYLLLISVGWCAIVRLTSGWPTVARWVRGDAVRTLFQSPWKPLLCAIPTLCIFLIDVDTPFRVRNTFVPDLARVAHYSVFFVAGVWLATMPQVLACLRQQYLTCLACATGLFVGMVPLALSYFTGQLGPVGSVALSVLSSLYAWCMILGLMGAGVTWCTSRRSVVQYLNEASFWIYLVHVPVVNVWQVALADVNIPSGVKLAIATVGTLLVALTSYKYCVRYSLLGVIVQGGRQHSDAPRWRWEAGWLTAGAAMALFVGGFMAWGWDCLLGNHLHPVIAGRVYRCNRLSSDALEQVIATHGIRSVINIPHGSPDMRWFAQQQEVCDRLGVPLASLGIQETHIPATESLEQLRLALLHAPRPVLIQGGKRSPTLSGLGSAVAILMEGGPADAALGQFDRRYFQLEGPEHCLVAQPLRAYQQWLQRRGETSTAKTFTQWSQTEHLNEQALAELDARQPGWQTRIGAPRFPRPSLR